MLPPSLRYGQMALLWRTVSNLGFRVEIKKVSGVWLDGVREEKRVVPPSLALVVWTPPHLLGESESTPGLQIFFPALFFGGGHLSPTLTGAGGLWTALHLPLCRTLGVNAVLANGRHQPDPQPLAWAVAHSFVSPVPRPRVSPACPSPPSPWPPR